jgi:hypothetical protein
VTTAAWILILSALLVLRAVSRGRVMNIGEDLSDAFLAIANGNADDLAEVFKRTGDSTTPDTSLPGLDDAAAALGSVGPGLAAGIGSLAGQAGTQLSDIQKDINKNLAFAAVELGTAAKGYVFGAAGPKYYDCSGLMYRAAQKVGYKGPRFFTSTVRGMPGFHPVISTPAGVSGPSQVTIGDVVLWPGHHMGVVTGNNKFYSARNPRSGIGETSISGFRKENPIYLRFTGK